MRNLILISVAAVVFCVVGIASPNVLIAQDAAEEDLESASSVAQSGHTRDGDMRNRREDFRDRDGGVTGLPEDPPNRRESFRDREENLGDRREDRRARRENYQDPRRNRHDHQMNFQGHRGYRGDHRRDFKSHREFGRDHKWDFRAHRKFQMDHKRYYSSRLDHRKRYFANSLRYKQSGRSYKGGGWGKAHRR